MATSEKYPPYSKRSSSHFSSNEENAHATNHLRTDLRRRAKLLHWR
jgi:hypothetical protein